MLIRPSKKLRLLNSEMPEDPGPDSIILSLVPDDYAAERENGS